MELRTILKNKKHKKANIQNRNVIYAIEAHN